MAITSQYNSQFAGRAITPNPATGSFASLYNSIPTRNGNNPFTAVNSGSYILTGWLYQTSDFQGSVFAQTTDGLYADCDPIDGLPAWNISDKVVQGVTQSSAQKMLDKLVNNNIHVYQNLCLLKRYSGRLTTAQLQAAEKLAQNLEYRDAMLQNSDGMLTNVKTGGVAGYSALLVSVGSITAIVVLSVVVVAALSTAAYYYYKAALAQSEKDVKYSDELTRILTEKLTDAEYEQLKQETAGLVTKQKILANISGGFAGAKWMLIAALAVLAIPMIKENYRKIKK